MNIGGLNPLSMIDFPGTPSAVVFTNGCNLSCPYCHNPLLAKGISPQIPEQEVKEFLKSRVGKLQGVVISGGEPTLQPDLLEFCRFCKELGYKVKVDTNGTNMLHAGFTTNMLDYVAVDLKHFSAVWVQRFFRNFDYQDIEHNFRSFASDLDSMEFRLTCVRPFVYEEVLFGFLEHLRGRHCEIYHPLYLQHCNVTPEILNPEFFESGKGKPWTQEEIYNFVEKYGNQYNVKAR